MAKKSRQNNTDGASTSRAALCSLIGSLGLLVIAIAVLIPIMKGGFPESDLYKWLFSAGAVICMGASLFTKAPAGAGLRERRWTRIEGWSSVFFCAAAFLMWYPGASPREWLAFTLAGAVIRIIVFFRTARKKQ